MCRRLLFRAPERNRWAKPLIVHQVAVQCGALCWGFCARICVLMVARRPRGWTDLEQRQRQQEQQASSSRPRAAVARCCGAPSVSVIRLRTDAESSGVFNAVAPKKKKKKIAVGLLAAAALIPLFLTLPGFCDGDELLNPSLVRPLRPHRRAAHHP